TDWNHIATNGSTHLFCLGTLGTANDAHGTPSHMYGESDNDAAARVTTTCSGTFVRVYGSGIYRSGLGGAGTEKYLNYFYGNNDSKSGADKTQHHNLFVYFPERTINNTTMPAGFYNSNTNNTPATETIIGHRVAYCENGFNIDWSNNVFSCCNASDGCVQY
ncbi:MAG: hypothetical protein LBL46_01730, partial [Rickettsiales bacterium]|nr:hypothetical protein [Rickettsiales bacterium]